MNPDQGTELRSGRVINPSSETSSPTDPDMAQAYSNDSDTNENSDISSQLSEIKESYERRINELHQEFSQLKDLMMAIVSKSNNESQPSSSKGPSKPTQQQGFDTNAPAPNEQMRTKWVETETVPTVEIMSINGEEVVLMLRPAERTVVHAP